MARNLLQGVSVAGLYDLMDLRDHADEQEIVMVARNGEQSKVLSCVPIESEVIIRHTRKVLTEIEELPPAWLANANRWLQNSVGAVLETVQKTVSSFFGFMGMRGGK
jgi:hypothetical protein